MIVYIAVRAIREKDDGIDRRELFVLKRPPFDVKLSVDEFDGAFQLRLQKLKAFLIFVLAGAVAFLAGDERDARNFGRDAADFHFLNGGGGLISGDAER